MKTLPKDMAFNFMFSVRQFWLKTKSQYVREFVTLWFAYCCLTNKPESEEDTKKVMVRHATKDNHNDDDDHT